MLQLLSLLWLVASTYAAGQAQPAPSGAALADAHTHLTWYGDAALDMLVKSGVTVVRDCGGDVDQLQRWRNDIATGRRVGPRIFFSGPAIDGPKDAKFRRFVRTPDEGRAAVAELADAGVDFLKTHNAIPRETYFAILDAARERGLRVVSHLPRGVPAWEAAARGVSDIEHAAESLLASPTYSGDAATVDDAMAWWESPAGERAIQQLARQKIAVTPTLVAYEAFTEMRTGTPDYEPRRRVLAFLLRLTGRLHRAGVTILAGSDFASPISRSCRARHCSARSSCCSSRGSRGRRPTLLRGRTSCDGWSPEGRPPRGSRGRGILFGACPRNRVRLAAALRPSTSSSAFANSRNSSRKWPPTVVCCRSFPPRTAPA